MQIGLYPVWVRQPTSISSIQPAFRGAGNKVYIEPQLLQRLAALSLQHREFPYELLGPSVEKPKHQVRLGTIALYGPDQTPFYDLTIDIYESVPGEIAALGRLNLNIDRASGEIIAATRFPADPTVEDWSVPPASVTEAVEGFLTKFLPVAEAAKQSGFTTGKFRFGQYKLSKSSDWDTRG